MKKYIFIFSILFLGITNVFADSPDFKFNSSEISFENGKSSILKKSFSDKYSVSYDNNSSDLELENEIIELSRKTTYLLLGEPNLKEENSTDFYNMYKDYLKLRYTT